MLADIDSICAGSLAVTTLIGSNPMRLYAFGFAPQGVLKPYVVWQNIAGGPNNNLSALPDDDQYIIQVDVWAKTKDECIKVAKAISDAVDASEIAYVSSWNGHGVDTVTKNCRYSFSVDFIQQR